MVVSVVLVHIWFKLFSSLLLNLDCKSCVAAQLLPLVEVETLRTISSKLNNRYWNVTEKSCSGGGGFAVSLALTKALSNVTCNCTFNNNSICHVTNIQLKSLNLTGQLPDEFSKLAFLQEIDLTQNYINGTIPKTFGQLPLKTLSFTDNRIGGSIPPEIANISTLEELIMEDNQLGGSLPEELGRLSSLRRLLLSSNSFSGTIPETFGHLKNLSDFRIDGNQLSGKIPDFIGNWTKMEILNLQGTSMEGPIPTTISLLKNLVELRISDLNGSVNSFPDLRDMKNTRYLILRNCSINGPIPDYIGGFSSLKTLDLSFNKLAGQIPDSIEPIKSSLNFLYLNSNSLSGSLPSWISVSKQNFDVSYNNFSDTTSQYRCQASSVNLVASYSSSTSNSIPWCLKKDLPCSSGVPKYHSLFINCGGNRIMIGKNQYEDDLLAEGPSYFYTPSEKWAYSSTGVFIYNDHSNFVASADNVTGEEFYKTARLAPASLKYYGLCLRKGSYKVRLHFAEIQFFDDMTFSSIGRRIFDIYIQGNIVRKDFDIAKEANGFGKGIYFDEDVTVNGSTLEIHLYWAGKGTTAVPNRGIYGPLISAITVTPNFDVDTGGLSSGAIVGIVITSLVALALILVVLRIKGFLGGKSVEEKELQGAIELQTGYFSLRQIKSATSNFSAANKIGEGGFGPVYKGILADGSEIAVKQLSSKSKQGNREFINEIGMISALQHPNLVKLYGCCIEGNQLLLVYEYLENNSLARALFGRDDQRLNLDWSTRMKIFLGIARGLAYLHEESRLKIVHRDIKTTNVLLDRDLNAKISDFGLAKLDEEENTHISTRIAGTLGYMAPEYAMRGYLTDKADVYSFGMVALEIVSGKSNTSFRPKEESVYLLDWAYVLQEQGKLLDIVDPILGTDYSKEEAMRVLNIALLCSNPSSTLRPSMSAIVKMIEGKMKVRAPVFKRTDDMKLKAFEKLSYDSQTQSSTKSRETRRAWSMSSTELDRPWSDSSTSFASKDTSSSTSKLLPDLYDVVLD